MNTLHKQKGFIHNIILPSLIIMGIVLAGWSAIANKNQVGLNIARSADEARGQIKKIEDVLKWCKVIYPGGNNGRTYAAGAEGHVVLPASPADGSWVSARNLDCPGSGKNLWLASGEILTQPALYLTDWEYLNDSTGVYIRASADGAGDYGKAVLKQISLRMHVAQYTFTNANATLSIKLIQ